MVIFGKQIQSDPVQPPLSTCIQNHKISDLLLGYSLFSLHFLVTNLYQFKLLWHFSHFYFIFIGNFPK